MVIEFLVAIGGFRDLETFLVLGVLAIADLALASVFVFREAACARLPCWWSTVAALNIFSVRMSFPRHLKSFSAVKPGQAAGGRSICGAAVGNHLAEPMTMQS